MSISTYLGTAPLSELTRYSGGLPQDAVSFEGAPRQHPFEKDKILLVFDPLGEAPTIMEFRIVDIVHVEELASPVTEEGEGFKLVKVWVRRGSFGIMHEAFEVQNPIKLMKNSKVLHERIMKSFK